mmetsp:Transcript_97479/g.232019  ORF Transcript_97479/g.232019 Transcript_97479/m.232019 type:complete len:150 (+) Transcript_97479:329-778(+)
MRRPFFFISHIRRRRQLCGVLVLLVLKRLAMLASSPISVSQDIDLETFESKGSLLLLGGILHKMCSWRSLIEMNRDSIVSAAGGIGLWLQRSLDNGCVDPELHCRGWPMLRFEGPARQKVPVLNGRPSVWARRTTVKTKTSEQAVLIAS